MGRSDAVAQASSRSDSSGVGSGRGIAAGDIIDWKEQKQAAKANTHVQVVSANVVSFLEGKPYKKKYKGSPEMILIPLGKV